MPRGVPRNRTTGPEPAPEPGGPGAGGAVDSAVSDFLQAAAHSAPTPDVELTAEQLRIKDLENLLAQERGRKDPEPELVEVVQPGREGNILIHFLEDGFSALGQVWYRGQELEFEAGSPAYRDTCDRRGWSWLELRHDEFAQVERYGKVMFRSGPWPGKSYEDAVKAQFETVRGADGSPVPAPNAAELRQAAEAEARRRRAAPRLSLR
jgi:hypothetical protein